MWEYTGKVKDHFLNPRNVGEIEDPDGVAEVGSIACGDALKFTFKLDENKRIKDAKFKISQNPWYIMTPIGQSKAAVCKPKPDSRPLHMR